MRLVHITGGYDLTRRGSARQESLKQSEAAMDAHNIP